MKGSLTFKLPEEQEDFQLACHARVLQIAIEEMFNVLRTMSKYEEHTEAEYKLIETIREKFRECTEDINHLLF